MQSRKTGAVSIFIGALLIVIFVVGLIVTENPSALTRPRRYDMALESFGSFCASVWLPAGIIGIPLFLFSLVRSLIRDRKDKQNQ